MLASLTHYRKYSAKSLFVSSPLLRRLNLGTLAFVLFVVFALLGAVCSQHLNTGESPPANCHNAPHASASIDSQFQQPPVSEATAFAAAGTNSQSCSQAILK